MLYSSSVWLAPVAGTFPTAGRYNYAGHGGVGVSTAATRTDRALIRYLHAHSASADYPLLTESSDQAAPLILLGLRADAVGGYNATDPAMSAGRLADLVASGRARYVLIGGEFALRGGNPASNAARLVCPEVPTADWTAAGVADGSYLVDCTRRARALRHPSRAARAFLRAHPDVHYVL